MQRGMEGKGREQSDQKILTFMISDEACMLCVKVPAIFCRGAISIRNWLLGEKKLKGRGGEKRKTGNNGKSCGHGANEEEEKKWREAKTSFLLAILGPPRGKNELEWRNGTWKL